ncbi:CUB domain [Cinara cedri]|uniref:CUB domain n=1 Tax=Cinara cedri TaxID=506608 RepID=A0A5E4LZ51_9HEMI|nr:CUB domain [Cinara cedri]
MNWVVSKQLMLWLMALLLMLPFVNGTILKWFKSLINHSNLSKKNSGNNHLLPVIDFCLPNDFGRTGQCLLKNVCKKLHGESYSACAYDIGKCCVFTATCNDVITNNNTYFVNPTFPGVLNNKSECELRINILNYVRHLRLDFVNFNLAQPNRTTGVCVMDKFVITGGSSRHLLICGNNTGQHMYYDVHNTKNVTIKISLGSANYSRMWEIKITQVKSLLWASEDCVQQFQGINGTIQTMNYGINGRHLADQSYFICIKQEKNMCSIVYQPCNKISFKIETPLLSADTELEEGSGESDNLAYTDSYANCKDRVSINCKTDGFLTVCC